jgi:cytoskeletal protein RodZ
METSPHHSSKALLLAVVSMAFIILLLVGIIGWLVGRRDTATSNQPSSSQNATPQATTTSAGRVTDLVAFDVPGGWEQQSCDNQTDVIYFVPSSESPDCSAEPQTSITLAIDPGNATDCNQLQNVQNVQKHVCRSIFIDNRKTLEAQTIYNQQSSVLPGRTVDAYFIDTGKGVVRARYIHSGNAAYGTIFNDLVKGLRVR